MLGLVNEFLCLPVKDLRDLIELRDPHLSGHVLRLIEGILGVNHLLLETDQVDVELLLSVCLEPNSAILRLRDNRGVSHELAGVKVAVRDRLSLVYDLRR